MVAPDTQRIAYLSDLPVPTTDAAQLSAGYLSPARLNLTAANGVAVRSAAGALVQVLLSSAVAADTLAYRGTGGTLAVGTPTADTHAATKAYVDARPTGGAAGTVDAPIQRVIYQRADGTWPKRPDRSNLYTYDWRALGSVGPSTVEADGYVLRGVDTILYGDAVAA